MNGPFNLQRFLDAQKNVIASVLSQLKQGRKCGHWIWFIFPQLKGLGHSSNSEFYGISSLQEARVYLQHPILGPRLRTCTELVNAIEGSSIEHVFGEVDAMKFRSSMTLFAEAAPQDQIFTEALTKYFEGDPDQLTLSRLQEQT